MGLPKFSGGSFWETFYSPDDYFWEWVGFCKHLLILLVGKFGFSCFSFPQIITPFLRRAKNPAHSHK